MKADSVPAATVPTRLLVRRMASLLTLNLIVVVRANPDVIVARAEKHRGTETFDKVFAVLYAPTFVGLLLVVRTALEDGMLTRRLSGYEAFTHQTRFRLLPGVW